MWALDGPEYHGVTLLLQIGKGGIEVVGMESQVVQLIPPFVGTGHRTALSVPVDLQGVPRSLTLQDGELSLVLRRLDAVEDPHAHDLGVKLHGAVQVLRSNSSVDKGQIHYTPPRSQRSWRHKLTEQSDLCRKALIGEPRRVDLIEVPYWECKVCREKLPTWSRAREHIYTVHNEEVMGLLGESMIPEMMLLDKHLEES